MAHAKGSPKTPGSGRQAGTPNKLTATFKEAVLMAFDNIGGVDHFTEWAKAHPTEFYKIAARLIPAEMQVQAEVQGPSLIDILSGMANAAEADLALEESRQVALIPSDMARRRDGPARDRVGWG
jgi:hypothetical protein